MSKLRLGPENLIRLHKEKSFLLQLYAKMVNPSNSVKCVYSQNIIEILRILNKGMYIAGGA